MKKNDTQNGKHMQSLDEIKPQLEMIMKGIAKQFGSDCEVVLHDHKKGLNKSVVAIENGHVTGRKIGDPSTNIGFAISKSKEQADAQYGYITKLPNGKILRSTSVYFKNDEGKVIGALCINLDITNISKVKEHFNFLTADDNKDVNENFTSNVSEILDTLIEQYAIEKNADYANMNKAQMIEFLSYLDEHGAFLIRNSGSKICKILNISKYTLYAYLKEISPQD